MSGLERGSISATRTDVIIDISDVIMSAKYGTVSIAADEKVEHGFRVEAVPQRDGSPD